MWAQIFPVSILKKRQALASSLQFRRSFSHWCPNQICSVLQQYIDSPTPCPGQKLHAHILKVGLRAGTGISIKLLILHRRSDCLQYARQIFDEMPLPTLSAYNYLIFGYIKQGCTVKALDIVRLLLYSTQKPDGFAFSMMLKLSAVLNWLALVKEVHGQLIRLICEWDDALFTGLLDSYCKNGRIDYARQVFDQMPEKCVISITAMISGYLKEGSLSKAEELFLNAIHKDVVVYNAMIEGYSKSPETAIKSLEMYIDLKRRNFHPTISTFVSVIGSCTILPVVDVGQQIHVQLLKSTVMLDVRSGSALIDMYSKFGRIEYARRVFHEMQMKNVVTWTAMIDGYGKNGDSVKALQLFNQMRQTADVVPNCVTFLSVLSSCSHAGLLSDGWDIFYCMERDYSMKPTMEHYACMVDLLGRLGHLEEAVEFVRQIPEKPSVDVWAALLGASKLHGDVKLSALAANEVFKLSGAERPGAYMALSNTFAAAGKWSNVCKLRELMKTRRVSKDVGSSWIGTDN